MKCLELLELSNHKTKVILLSLLFLFFNGFAVNIKLKQFSKVETQNIYLKDIAFIHTKNQDFKQFLQNIVIDKSPPPQKTKLITKKQIIEKLKNYHLDLSSIRITGNKTLVLSDFRELPLDKVKKDIASFLKKHVQNIKIQSINITSRKLFVPSKYKTNIHIRSKTGNYIYLDYIVSFNQKSIKLPISVQYSTVKTVVIANKYIPKGKKISQEDIKLIKMSNVRDEFIENIKQAVGKIAKVNIKANSPIKKYYLKPDFLVKKNDKVKVIYSNKVIRVELIGQALENGEKGQIIKVKNISSGKKIKCKVIDRKTVLFIGN